MNETIGEETALDIEVSDAALERAAGGQSPTPNPTVPGGLICIPFENA